MKAPHSAACSTRFEILSNTIHQTNAQKTKCKAKKRKVRQMLHRTFRVMSSAAGIAIVPVRYGTLQWRFTGLYVSRGGLALAWFSKSCFEFRVRILCVVVARSLALSFSFLLFSFLLFASLCLNRLQHLGHSGTPVSSWSSLVSRESKSRLDG